MPTGSVQYDDNKKLATARAAAALVARWGVPDAMVARLIDGEGRLRIPTIPAVYSDLIPATIPK